MSTPRRIAEWLRRHQQRDGRIRCPLHGDRGHYAEGFAALAFGLLALRTGDPDWIAACDRALAAARQAPNTSEFQAFARVLLARMAADDPRFARWSDAAAIPLYRGGRLVSHNIRAMRAAAFALRARLTGHEADRRVAERLWADLLAQQQRCGLFSDCPGGVATPTTYHAKCCAMLALTAELAGDTDPHRMQALRRGLAALARLVSPGGMLVPYGRSPGSLFGAAAAIAALRWGGRRFGERDWANASARLERALAAWQRPDGHLPALLAEGEAERRGWDVYLSNVDYNAYAAALLLLSEPAATGDAAATGSDDLAVAEIGPLVLITGGGWFVAVVGRGQSVPFGAPFFCDHRYYGIQPLWIERGGQCQLGPAPFTWYNGSERLRIADPAENPYLPYLEWQGERAAARTLDRLVIDTQDRRVILVGEGELTCYRPWPRWRRAVAELLYPLGAPPPPVFVVRTVPGVRLRHEFCWDVQRGALALRAELLGTPPGDSRFVARSTTWRVATTTAATG